LATAPRRRRESRSQIGAHERLFKLATVSASSFFFVKMPVRLSPSAPALRDSPCFSRSKKPGFGASSNPHARGSASR
jgi:hypothetical protein